MERVWGVDSGMGSVGERGVGVEEVAEAENGEDVGDYAADEAEEEEDLEE